MLVERARAWLGAKIVQIGIRVAGFDAGKLEPQNEPEEHPDEVWDEYSIGGVAVELTETARAMVQDGMRVQPNFRPPRPKAPAPSGSIAARIQEAKDRNEAALRPRRG